MYLTADIHVDNIVCANNEGTADRIDDDCECDEYWVATDG